MVPWGQHQCMAIHPWGFYKVAFDYNFTFFHHSNLKDTQENPGLKAARAAHSFQRQWRHSVCVSQLAQIERPPLRLHSLPWPSQSEEQMSQPHARGISSILLYIGRNFSSEKLEIWFLKIHSFPEVVNTDVMSFCLWIILFVLVAYQVSWVIPFRLDNTTGKLTFAKLFMNSK